MVPKVHKLDSMRFLEWLDARSHICRPILRNGLQSFIHKRRRHIELWRWWTYEISWHGGLNSIICFWKRRCGCHLGWKKGLQVLSQTWSQNILWIPSTTNVQPLSNLTSKHHWIGVKTPKQMKNKKHTSNV